MRVVLALVLVLGMNVAASLLHAQDKPATPPEAGTPAGAEAAKTAQQPKSAKQKDRVFYKDIEGTWIARPYQEKLTSTRSPRAAASANMATAIKIQRDGVSYPMLITNFKRAVLQAIIDIQPTSKPKSYRLAVAKEDTGVVNASDLKFIYFNGERNADGVFKTLSIAEPHFSKRKFVTYVRLDGELEKYVNNAVIAGKYRDAQGAAYEFTEAGEAVLPDRKFVYEVSLDAPAAKCDVIVSHTEREAEGKERIGFAWKGDALQLFEVTGSKAPLTCAAKPFAQLTRQ